MLVKLIGNVYISKLIAILLLEVDFNVLNKIVFDRRALPSIEASNTIPFEVIGGRKGQSSIYIALNKKLVYDIGNHYKKPTVMVSIDAFNCYNRIAHSISSMVCQHFRLQLEYLMTLFGTIQTIKIFLHISFGVLEQFYTRTVALPFQGGVQGNRAALPLQLILLIMLVRYLYASKQVSVRQTVISKTMY